MTISEQLNEWIEIAKQDELLTPYFALKLLDEELEKAKLKIWQELQKIEGKVK